MKTKDLVILLHGHLRTASNMGKMKKHLEAFGYDVFAPYLPTTFKRVEGCTRRLEKIWARFPSEDYGRVHFVGHSMGGLIIRLFLSRNKIPNIGRCVLIATPNQGSDLAEKVNGVLYLAALISPPFLDFRPPGLPIGPPLNQPAPEFGVIAGNMSPLIPGALIKRDNDGRVAVQAAAFKGMKAFTVIPFRHTRIHKKSETAGLVNDFLQNGHFEEIGGVEQIKAPMI